MTLCVWYELSFPWKILSVRNALIKSDIHWTELIHSIHLQTHTQSQRETGRDEFSKAHAHAIDFNSQRTHTIYIFYMNRRLSTAKCFRVKMRTNLHNYTWQKRIQHWNSWKIFPKLNGFFFHKFTHKLHASSIWMQCV